MVVRWDPDVRFSQRALGWQVLHAEFQGSVSDDNSLPDEDFHFTEWPDDLSTGYRDSAQVFGCFQLASEMGCIMVADDGKRKDGNSSNAEPGSPTNAKGVVPGHAYSVIRVVSNVAGSGFDLLQLRNTWAGTEWNGDWSDESNMWTRYPAVKRELKPVKIDNGTFA